MSEYGKVHTDGSRSGGQKPEVPEWALRRAVDLAGFPVQVDDENKPLTWRYSLYNAGLDAFARYIAAHEQPPVDPLLAEAREMCAKWAEDENSWVSTGAAQKYRDGKWDGASHMVIALASVRRGRDIGRAERPTTYCVEEIIALLQDAGCTSVRMEYTQGWHEKRRDLLSRLHAALTGAKDAQH